MRNPRSILITGGSSGIGAALAEDYAAPGVFLALSGRNAGRLEAVAEVCREAGATVTAEIIDVTKRDAMRAWVERVDDGHPLDLVIANAGISCGRNPGEAEIRDVFAVNMAGVLNTVLPALPRMQRRGMSQEDVTLIIRFGTETDKGFLLREKDVAEAERHLKRRIATLRRLAGKLVVADGDTVITAFHATPKQQRRMLR